MDGLGPIMVKFYLWSVTLGLFLNNQQNFRAYPVRGLVEKPKAFFVGAL